MKAPSRFTLTRFRNSVEHVVRRRVKPTLALVESVGVDIKVDITQYVFACKRVIPLCRRFSEKDGFDKIFYRSLNRSNSILFMSNTVQRCGSN